MPGSYTLARLSGSPWAARMRVLASHDTGHNFNKVQRRRHGSRRRRQPRRQTLALAAGRALDRDDLGAVLQQDRPATLGLSFLLLVSAPVGADQRGHHGVRLLRDQTAFDEGLARRRTMNATATFVFVLF